MQLLPKISIVILPMSQVERSDLGEKQPRSRRKEFYQSVAIIVIGVGVMIAADELGARCDADSKSVITPIQTPAEGS